jgi:hypothetical protein
VRNLASIQKIVAKRPIEKADRIEVVQVQGWECVVNKSDNYQVGDLVVYIEVDSIVPDRPEFGFLRERKFRVRTIKLRGQVSQGLVLPLSILPKGTSLKEGHDVTEELKIKKYDPQGEAEEKLLQEKTTRSNNRIIKFLSRFSWYRRLFRFLLPKRSNFPSFIKKTDEERIQNLYHICEKEKDTFFSATEKLDGCSATYFLVKNKKKALGFGQDYIFGVCSRNLYLPKPDNSYYWKIAKMFAIEQVLKYLIGNEDYIVLQGEIIGEGIQGNKYGVKGLDFYAYNLIYATEKVSSLPASATLCLYGIKFVPILYNAFKLAPTIPESVECAKGKSVLADIQREGLVVRSYEKNISFKIINPDFLLKYEE